MEFFDKIANTIALARLGQVAATLLWAFLAWAVIRGVHWAARVGTGAALGEASVFDQIKANAGCILIVAMLGTSGVAGVHDSEDASRAVAWTLLLLVPALVGVNRAFAEERARTRPPASR